MGMQSAVRTQIKAALNNYTDGTYTLNTDRVRLGQVASFYTADFLKSLAGMGSTSDSEAGPYVIIRDGIEASLNPSTRKPNYVIPIDIYFGIAQNEDNDYVAIEDFLERVWKKIRESGQVIELSYSKDDTDAKNNPTTLHYRYLATAWGC